MDRIWEYIWRAWIAIWWAGLAISVVLAHAREKRFSFAQTALLFLIGIACEAAGLLQLVDVVRKERVEAIRFSAGGVPLIQKGVCTIPLSVTMSEYIGRTLTVIVGVVTVSGAVLTILIAYR